jgi:hypothetical protein
MSAVSPVHQLMGLRRPDSVTLAVVPTYPKWSRQVIDAHRRWAESTGVSKPHDYGGTHAQQSVAFLDARYDPENEQGYKLF